MTNYIYWKNDNIKNTKKYKHNDRNLNIIQIDTIFNQAKNNSCHDELYKL